MTKKTFYYNFFPPKSEVETWIGMSTEDDEVGKVLVEIRDIYHQPVLDYQNPWKIKKKLTHFEVAGGKILIPFHDTFEHIFRHWSFSTVNHAVLGNKVSVLLWDVTEKHSPKQYLLSDNFFLELMPNDHDYILTCKELFFNRKLEIDDEIGMFYDPRMSYFQFKLFRKIII